mmetsp:Transcript_61778/g.191769  ORF Transcript_61778/g.191769 Transcript_61778/m.191769 type:complete len:362 (-) Transcript_61778:1635-2720(-)
MELPQQGQGGHRHEHQPPEELADVVVARAAGRQPTVVPLAPTAALLRHEEAPPPAAIGAGLGVLELVGVVDVRSPQVGDDRKPEAHKPTGDAHRRRRGDHARQDRQRGKKQRRSLIVRHGRELLIEAGAPVAILADEGLAVRGQLAPRGYVLGTSPLDLVDEVVADDLPLEDEEERGERELLLQQAADGRHDALLQPQLREQGHGRGEQEEEEERREELAQPDRRQRRGRPLLPLGLQVPPAHRVAVLHGPCAAVEAVEREEEPHQHQQLQGEGEEELAHVEAGVVVEEGQHPLEAQAPAEPEDLPREHLLARACGELGEEAQDRVEAEVAALGHVEVLAVADPAALTAQREVHARKDVLR